MCVACKEETCKMKELQDSVMSLQEENKFCCVGDSFVKITFWM